MDEKTTPKKDELDNVEVNELEDQDLEDVAGGGNFNCGCNAN